LLLFSSSKKKMADAEKLEALSNKTYKEQAVWFLNAYWDKFSSESEKIWDYVHGMVLIDHEKKAEGSALDEAQAHRFLEKFDETMTVAAMREKLRSTGAIGAKIKLVPLIHMLIFKYNVDWKYLVNAPQGNQEEIAKAQALLDEVQAAFQISEARAQEAKEALREAQAREAEAKARENEAKAREADARAQEAPFKAAQEEVDRALADVKAQETARDSLTAELKRKSNEGGVVQQNKAKAELAQHLAKDPLPLSRAKITLEAALKKAEKARAPFEAATKQAEEARAVAEKAASQATQARTVADRAAKEASSARATAESAAKQAGNARAKSEEAKAAAEAALEEATRRLEEAEAYLEEAKNRLPKGAIWWLERELHEKRKYLPERKGGIKKN